MGRFRLLVTLLAVLIALPSRAWAQSSSPSQYDVQAVYLYNFAKFVRWPPRPEPDAITICVAAEKKTSDTLAKVVAGEKIDAHPLAVRSVEGSADVAGCDILFVGEIARDRLESLLRGVSGKPVLTVSDVPDFLERGGMIQFVVIEHRVRFSVDLRPVLRSGIALNSELLKVAVHVAGQPSGGGIR